MKFLMRKCMIILSVLLCFLEAALKRQLRVNEAEIMSTQLKTSLALHCSGRMMLEKMIDWETHVQILSSK